MGRWTPRRSSRAAGDNLMERTVPSTASEEVELYLRTTYSLLRSTSDVHIRTLEEAHAGMRSLLHPAARDTAPDMAAFIYSLLRLPACIKAVQLVVLGQSTAVFSRQGFTDIESWEPVSAIARRRRSSRCSGTPGPLAARPGAAPRRESSRGSPAAARCRTRDP